MGIILGFYYHIPCFVSVDGKIGMPSFQGLFVDSLATKVDHLYCFLHVQKVDGSIDYWLTSSNITIVSLGPDSPAYIKTFFPSRFVSRNSNKFIALCDKIIVRGPSPLLHQFRKIASPDKIIYFIIGSYKEGLKYIPDKWYRRYAIRLLLGYIDNKQEKVLRGSKILVNSQANKTKYSKIARKVGLVYTTTLKDTDFFIREDTCRSETIKLMFIGRLDRAKGLYELTRAFQIINKEHNKVELHFVGWENNPTVPVKREIEAWANTNNLGEKIIFHGKKTAGPELLEYYREGDIYVLPSYHEGFPRTIWEAMASSLPVITTNVDTIPDFLTHKENAYLIPPHNQSALVNAIREVIADKNLRQRLIQGGLQRAKEVTLEVQANKLIKFISDE